ncbi:hypothetical protein PI124_g10361 [Phytophthora idaei]|nr:hypothetical protein PI124_g10361 [Phytophthora idaei]
MPKQSERQLLLREITDITAVTALEEEDDDTLDGDDRQPKIDDELLFFQTDEIASLLHRIWPIEVLGHHLNCLRLGLPPTLVLPLDPLIASKFFLSSIQLTMIR